MNEHLNDYTLIRFEIRIRIVAADSIRDSIRAKISDSQVPTFYRPTEGGRLSQPRHTACSMYNIIILRVRRATRNQQLPEWAILTHIDCFSQCEIMRLKVI